MKRLYDRINTLRTQAAYIYDLAISKGIQADIMPIMNLLNKEMKEAKLKDVIQAIQSMEMDNKAHRSMMKLLLEKIEDNDTHINKLRLEIINRMGNENMLSDGDSSATLINDTIKIR